MAETPARPPKFLDQVRTVIRLRRLSYQTEKAYVDWIKRFIRFHQMRHPRDLGAPEIEAYLTYLVTERKVAPSTQNQAMHALLFLYKQVLLVELPRLAVPAARKAPRLPTVFTRDEVQGILARMEGRNLLMANLLYGTGMRLKELLRLRVKDIDFTQNQIIIREGKGSKDRVTMLPLASKRHCGNTWST